VLNDHFNILEAANIADCKSFLELSMKISKFYNKLLLDARTEKADRLKSFKKRQTF